MLVNNSNAGKVLRKEYSVFWSFALVSLDTFHLQLYFNFGSSDLKSPLKQARIALERRRFLKNAETAVQRQAMWSNLAHEMTAEFRGLCAEEVMGNSFTFL